MKQLLVALGAGRCASAGIHVATHHREHLSMSFAAAEEVLGA